MLVSIITPSFNQGEFIEATIQSVINQTYSEIEYILIDACSTDETVQVLGKYQDHPRISRIICEKDDGQSDAINKGFKLAQGEIVGWINSDDCLAPDIVERAVDLFKTNKDVGITYGDIIQVDRQGVQLSLRRPPGRISRDSLLNTDYDVYQPGSFYRKNIIESVGYIDKSLYYCMDLDLWLRMLDGCMSQYIPHVSSYFRVYPETKTKLGGVDFLNEILCTLDKYGARRISRTRLKIFYYILKTKIKSFVYMNTDHRQWTGDSGKIRHTKDYLGGILPARMLNSFNKIIKR